jgi:hypothetical protein
MAKNPKIKLARAWAVVEKNGRIQVETCSRTKSDASMMLTMHDEETGCKVRRVTIVCQMP